MRESGWVANVTTSIAENIASVQRRIALAARRSGRRPEHVTLVAITKGADAAAVREAHAAGLRDFGENRLQEAQGKLAALSDIRAATTWHMVGHVQTNKARSCIDLFDIIHSIDSIHLGEALDRRAEAPVAGFLEVNVTKEATKHGFSPEDLPGAFEGLSRLRHLDIRGLMTVAPMARDPETARPIFHELRELANRLGLAGLSMGMTNDFEVAVEEGATLVRIGGAIFGRGPTR